MAALIPVENRLFAWEYVQLHSVAEGGEQRQFHSEGPCVIGQLAEPSKDASTDGKSPPVLQIGMPENMLTWKLTSDLPTLKVKPLAFMFAVPYSQRFYVVEFLPEAPQETVQQFEGMLQTFTAFAVSEEVSPANMPGKEQVASADGTVFTTTPSTAQKIEQAGQAISTGIQAVGEQVGKGVVFAGEWYRKRSQAKRSNVAMDPATMARLETAKATTEKVAAVTTSVASAVGAAIGSVAKTAADAARGAGLGKEGTTSGAYKEVGKASVVALVEVFDAMHDAGRHVLHTSATETTTSVQYRYGDEAGAASQKGTAMAVDAYDVYGAYKSMRTTALAKAFVKGAVIKTGDEKPNGAEEGKADTSCDPSKVHMV